jgi:putative permease
MHILKKWFSDYLSDPQIIIFILIGIFFLLVFMTLGEYLAPVVASIVLAYLLESLIRPLERLGVPRLLAVTIVFLFFILALVFLVIGLLPMLTKQIVQFVRDLPQMITSWQAHLENLPERYPQLITQEQIDRIMGTLSSQMAEMGQNVLSFSLASVRSMVNFVVYLILVPLMSFFFLKDQERILVFLKGFLPENIGLASQVWQEVNQKIAKFIQGKIWEILIVWVLSYLVFFFLDLRFAILLSFMVGMSVIIPYVGAIAMTIPVALVAFFQWGLDAQFAYVLVAYFILQQFDGNLLAPLLLAGIVNLHPLAVIIGVLIFGGLWGFWGVLFAIPLATLVHAIIKAWPRKAQEQKEIAGADSPPS